MDSKLYYELKPWYKKVKRDKKKTAKIINSIDERNKLIEENKRLVIPIAETFLERYRIWDFDLNELISVGTGGLLLACERWDRKKGRLSTYSRFWIRREIGLFVQREIRHKKKTITQEYTFYDEDDAPKISDKFFDADNSLSVDNKGEIKRILHNLPKRDKEFINLRYLKGWSDYEIAKKHGLTRQAVNQSINKILEEIRKKFQK